MPREFALAGIYFPTLLALFVGAAAIYWLLDGLLARWGLYRYVWHPPLFRFALFVCLFGSVGLLVYR
ncbi:MAG: DUF1656 domain-containing protein [Stenotrophobium sp.]